MATKFSFKNVLLVSFLALAGIFSLSSVIINKQAEETPVVEEAKADGDTYNVCGTFTNWSHTTLTDDDDDGVYSGNFTVPAGDQRFAITVNNSWDECYRYDNLLIKCGTGWFWAVDWDYNNIGIKMADSGDTNVTICFRADDQAVMVFPQGSAPSSWHNFYIVVNHTDGDDWSSDWSNPRMNYWGSNWTVVWEHVPSLTDLSRTYTGGGHTGDLYSISIPSSTSGVQALKPSTTDGATQDLNVSSGSVDGGSFYYYDDKNYLNGFKFIEDGYYLRGIYQGNEDWNNNAVLSNTTVTESIIYNTTDNQLHATLELYGGDTFKFIRYENGVSVWVGGNTTESSDSKYYPASQDGGSNFIVSNDGIYYINLGYHHKSGSDEYWWAYFDNSASVYAYEFLNSMTCDDSGRSEPEWKQIPDKEDYYSWEYFSDYYTYHLDDYAKDTFYEADSNPSGTNIENAVARYQIIIKNHGYTPFMKDSSGTLRSAPNSINPFVLISSDEYNMSTMIIIIASSVALLSITALSVLLVKKKHIKTKEE